jgi:hypothetical protein
VRQYYIHVRKASLNVPAELAIGDRPDASGALQVDNRADRGILYAMELLKRAIATIEGSACLQERCWPLERANMVCAERRVQVGRCGLRHGWPGKKGRQLAQPTTGRVDFLSSRPMMWPSDVELLHSAFHPVHDSESDVDARKKKAGTRSRASSGALLNHARHFL